MIEGKTFSPELLSRQGEITAWGLTAATALGLFFLSQRTGLPYWAWFLFALLLFSAASISLGNWMDRHTFIRLGAEGVDFENGLRRVHMDWAMVEQVRTAPARWGTSVQVSGRQAYFAFSTLGEMRYQGQVRGRTGFSAGREIMDEIIHLAGLTSTKNDGQFQVFSRP